MTMHRLGAGDGYRYLTDSVAKGDGAKALAAGGAGSGVGDYYMATGNPPGRWAGSGTEAMGIEGRVTTRQMHNLYGLGLHPETGVQLGRRYALYRSVAERVRDRIDDAERALGHAMRPDARAHIEREEISKGERQAVAGFDCVFSPVKSVSLAWALTDDPWVAAEVEAAHHAAVAHVIEWIERDVAFARTGAGGVAQVNVDGVTVALFDHRTSRAGDPDLHTHAVISNKVRARVPGEGTRWLTLDSMTMHKAVVAASERYNATLEDEITRRLGWAFEVRADQDAKEPTAIREVAGVPLDVIRGFSARRAQVEAHYARLIADYHREHGYTPPKDVQYDLAQQATLSQRPAKDAAESVGQERQRWAAQAAQMLDEVQRDQLALAITPGQTTFRRVDADITADQVAELARAALDDVTRRRSTWTQRHVMAAVHRATRGWQFASPEARSALADRVVDVVLEARDGVSDAVRLDPPELVAAPAVLRRENGESVFTRHASDRYTTTRQLEAEDRLLAHAARADAPLIRATDVSMAASLVAAEGLTLTPDQFAAVTRLATAGRGLGLLIGPAGTGKTTTMKGLVTAWQIGTGRAVHGLAPTAAAAAVLKAETGMTATETIHKWALSTESNGGFREGDLVIVDEAGMVGTSWLLEVADAAQEAGAKVILAGDYRQLSAVESGGALRLLATDAPDSVAELTTVWRFADRDPATGERVIRQWEADASLSLRDGAAVGLDPYFAHERVVSGAEAVLADRLYEAWRADEIGGLTSLMIATSNETVADLGRRARADLVAAGRVEADGVALSDGNIAGVGDVVVTRKNNRLMRAGQEFVKNGDLWHVEARGDDGSLEVRHVTHGGRVTLPADYVEARVEQGYAMTVHRAQGSTVDTAYALVDGTWSRELLYVAMTRGRITNVAHVVTDHVLDPDVERPADPDRLARAVLTDVLKREAGDVSATETLREAQDAAGSMRTLLPRFRYAADLHQGSLARDLVRQGTPAELAERVLGSPAWPSLSSRVSLLAERGVDVDRVIAATLEQRPIDGATDPAAILHSRLTPTVVQSRPPAGDWLPPAPAGDEPLSPTPATVPEYLRAMRAEMDARVSSLGAAAAFEQPAWAAALPPVPTYGEEERRAAWEQLAGRVAAYREAYEVTGLDPLGELPKEPRQLEAHAHLAAAVEEALAAQDHVTWGDTAATVEVRLASARERLHVAQRDYFAAERETPQVSDAGREAQRVESAYRLRDRLVKAELAERSLAWATGEHAATAGELAIARAQAEQGSRRERRAAEQRAAVLEQQLAEAAAERDRRIAEHVEAQAGLPHPDAREAAQADAERTLAQAGELMARVEAEQAARDVELGDRRAAAAAAFMRARADVEALERRARELGVEVRPLAPAGQAPVDDDQRRPEVGDGGRGVER